MAIMGGGTLLSLAQGQAQGKAQEEANAKQAELLEEQNRRLEKIQEKVKTNPAAVGELDEALRGPRESFYSMPQGLMAGLKGVGKDVINYLKTGRELKVIKNSAGTVQMGYVPRYQTVIGNAMAGVATAGVGFGVNKAIQADRKKNGFNDAETLREFQQQNEKTYSLIGTAGKVVSETFKNHKGSILAAGAFGALPAVGYITDKMKQGSQVAATQQKEYSLASYIKPLQDHFGKTILGAANKMASFGSIGRRDIGRFADYMAKSKNGWSQKIGDFMSAKDKAGNILYETLENGEKVRMANKKALLGTAATASAAVGAAWTKTEDAFNKVGRKVDPNAYAYQDLKSNNLT